MCFLFISLRVEWFQYPHPCYEHYMSLHEVLAHRGI